MNILTIFFILNVPSEEIKANLIGKKYVFYEKSRIDTTFDILHYFIELSPNHPIHFLEGKNKVRFKSLVTLLETLKLHLKGMNVDSIKRYGNYQGYIHADSILKIILSPPLNFNDSAEIEIFYSGYPSGGLYFKDSIVYADNEPWRAKRWYPCFDDPSDKALLLIKIKLPIGYKVIANGVKVDSIITGNEVIHVFKENYPITTYLTVFAASPYFVNVKDSFIYGNYNMPIYNFVFPQDTNLAKEKFERILWMLEYFSNTFGIYPFIEEKYAHVHAPIGGAMENQTNTFINMHLNWGYDWDWVVAHELSHQWFGDLVTCRTWMDIWLNEGFASYSEALWFGERNGVSAYHEYMEGMMNYYINNEPYPPFPIYNPPYLFHFAVVYRKGASVLHMLRHIIGDSTFFEAIRNYLQNFAYSSATTEDLRSVIESTSGQNLWWFFNEWVYLPGHPEYKFYWNYDSISPDSFKINLSILQVQSHNYNVPTYKMPVDIWILLSQGDTFKTFIWDSLDYQYFEIYVNKKPLDLLFDPENWILKEVEEIKVKETYSFKNDLFKISYINGQILLKYTGNKEIKIKLKIFDLSGRNLITKDLFLKPDKLFYKLDVKLSTGIYFIKLYPFLNTKIYVVNGDR